MQFSFVIDGVYSINKGWDETLNLDGCSTNAKIAQRWHGLIEGILWGDSVSAFVASSDDIDDS